MRDAGHGLSRSQPLTCLAGSREGTARFTATVIDMHAQQQAAASRDCCVFIVPQACLLVSIWALESCIMLHCQSMTGFTATVIDVDARQQAAASRDCCVFIVPKACLPPVKVQQSACTCKQV